MVLPIANPMMLGGVPLTTLTYIEVHTSFDANGTFTLGAGDIQSGDLLFVIQEALGSSDPASSPGTGFTSVTTAGGSRTSGKSTWYARVQVSYKIADGTENSTSIGGFMNATHGENYLMAVYRPDGAIAGVENTSSTDYGTNIGTISVGGDTATTTITYSATPMESTNGLNMTWSPVHDAGLADGSGTLRGNMYVGGVGADVTITETDGDSSIVALVGYVTVI